MAKDPAYPLYAQDFDMDTASWGTDEIGIYIRLLNYEWINGYLPNDITRIAKIVRISPTKLKKSWQIISKKFSQNGDNNLINRRMEEEREKRNKYIKSQRESGKKGAEIRWKKGNDPISDPISEPNSENIASHSHSHIHTQEKHTKGTKVPLCPHTQILSLYHEFLPGLRPMKVWDDDNKKILRSRWKEDLERQNLDWWKKLFFYIKESDFLMGDNDKDWTPNLEWIVKKSNLRKILNGNYDQKKNPLQGKVSEKGIRNIESFKNWQPPERR